MKRIFTVLAATLLLTAAMAVSASASDYDAVAEDLSAIGVFRGTSDGFELDRAPTRSEAAIMLVRLYGAEDEAKTAYEAGDITMPFTDVGATAAPYVAWLHDQGIVNGTTNFMLTKMVRENLGFDDALKIAQELGYAETKDPSDDVDGRDACRKIAILSSLVCGHQIYPQNIPTRGIRAITTADVEAAEKLGCVIKLIAWMKRGKDGSVAVGVEPCLVPKANQLASVDDVFNAVLVKGDMLGDVVFYGKGAGKLPTASAVVADVVDALKHGSKVHDSLFWQPAEPVEGMLTDPAPAAYYVRVAGIAPAVVEAIYGYGRVVDERYEGCAYFVERADEKALAEAARKVEAVGGSVKLVLKRLPEEN